jgi:hypothetical protein
MNRLAVRAALLAGSAAMLGLVTSVPASAATTGIQAKAVTAAPSKGDAVRPLYEMKVGPTTACGAFSGTLQWGGNGSILIPAYISLDGRVWNNACPGATEYVYISYTYAGAEYNPQIGKASYSPTANFKVNFSTESELFQYGNIKVDVCDNSNKGWHCGKAVGPGA